MMLNVSNTTYIALCGLVMDAMQRDSDAAPLLQKAAHELAAAMVTNPPPELAQNEHLRAAIADMNNRRAA